MINIWINCNGQVDPLNYDILYSYIIVATKLRRLLETYKDAKKIYFRDIAEKDKLLEQDAFVNKIIQEKHDLEAKFNKTKSDLEKENEELKEKIRLLENKNKQLEEEITLEPSIKDELAELRNLMFNLSNCEDTLPTNNDSWINSMKEVLPNWVFIACGVEHFDTALLKNKDYLFVNTVSNTHSMYYKAVENKDKNTKIRYINVLNRDRVLYEMENSL